MEDNLAHLRYLRTTDMSHDHFGFYLAWGCVAFVPTTYTIQVQYLARYPVHLSSTQACLLLAFGLSGYAIFRSANHQKDIGRSTNGVCLIWGTQAKYIRCKYKTKDQKTHESLLLCSGKRRSSPVERPAFAEVRLCDNVLTVMFHTL